MFSKAKRFDYSEGSTEITSVCKRHAKCCDPLSPSAKHHGNCHRRSLPATPPPQKPKIRSDKKVKKHEVLNYESLTSTPSSSSCSSIETGEKGEFLMEEMTLFGKETIVDDDPVEPDSTTFREPEISKQDYRILVRFTNDLIQDARKRYSGSEDGRSRTSCSPPSF